MLLFVVVFTAKGYILTKKKGALKKSICAFSEQRLVTGPKKCSRKAPSSPARRDPPCGRWGAAATVQNKHYSALQCTGARALPAPRTAVFSRQIRPASKDTSVTEAL